MLARRGEGLLAEFAAVVHHDADVAREAGAGLDERVDDGERDDEYRDIDEGDGGCRDGLAGEGGQAEQVVAAQLEIGTAAPSGADTESSRCR